MPKDLFLDFVNGRDGTVLKIKDRKDRIDIVWRPSNSLFGKQTFYNIPKDCVITIPSHELGLDYNWVIVLCDGTGAKGIINEKLNIVISQLVKKKEELERTTKLKETALAFKERDMIEKSKRINELFEKPKAQAGEREIKFFRRDEE